MDGFDVDESLGFEHGEDTFFQKATGRSVGHFIFPYGSASRVDWLRKDLRARDERVAFGHFGRHLFEGVCALPHHLLALRGKRFFWRRRKS